MFLSVMWNRFCLSLLLALIRPLVAADIKSVDTLVTNGQSAQQAGDFARAIRDYEEALKLAQANQETNLDILPILDKLASAYKDSGQYAEAQRHWLNALALVKATLGTDSLQYGVVTASLTTLPTNTASDVPNSVILKRLVLAHEQPPYDRDVVIIRIAFAQTLIYRKKYRAADEVLRATRAGLSASAKADRLNMAHLWSATGTVLIRQKRYKEALVAFRGSLEFEEAEHGKTHPALVLPLNNIGAMFLRVGDYEAANLTFQRALYLCYLANMHDVVYGITTENYAYLLKRMGRKKEAEQLAATSRSTLHDAMLQNGLGMTVSATP